MNYLHGLRRMLGTAREWKEQFWVALAMLLIAGAYEAGSAHFISDYSFNLYEFIGTWAGLICVWLSRTRNIWCWPWGIVSSLALGVFFGQISLPGQQWLNWGYFTVVQIWAWPHWVFGGKEQTELPVTSMSWRGRVLTILAIAAGTAAAFYTIDIFSPGSFHPFLDALVTSASVVAQFLLGRKKVESWVLWLGPVNLLSIVLFFSAGAYTVGALYVAFFIHAAFALVEWRKPSPLEANT